jgi:hypothetical protein
MRTAGAIEKMLSRSAANRGIRNRPFKMSNELGV